MAGICCPGWADAPGPIELAAGLVAALIIPALFAILWGHGRRLAGMIIGWALALLLHVTVAVVLVSSVYFTLEALLERDWRSFAKSLLTAAVILGILYGIARWGFPNGRRPPLRCIGRARVALPPRATDLLLARRRPEMPTGPRQRAGLATGIRDRNVPMLVRITLGTSADAGSLHADLRQQSPSCRSQLTVINDQA